MSNNATANGTSTLEIAQSNQDLIISKGKRRKRTWIVIGVISVIVVALLVAAIVLLVREDDEHEVKSHEPALSLDDVLEGHLNARSFNATWISDNELLYTDATNNLVLYDLKSVNTRPKVVLPSSDELILSAFEFTLSADKKFLMVKNGYQKIYRHSYRANHTIINLETGNRISLRVEDAPRPVNSGPFPPISPFLIQLAVWSPTGNAFVFVHENNIYYRASADSDETVKLTSTGQFVYNGIPDWVYEEEVFSSNKALWFSPDGKKLVFARFDDTQAPLMVVPIYGQPGSLQFQYPRANIVKYPKAGTRNPTVSLHFIDLNKTDDINNLLPPSNLQSAEHILSAVSWANNESICAIWMNRVQNEAAIVTYGLDNENPLIIRKLQETKGWLELFTAPKFSADGSQLILILSQPQDGNLGSFRHVTLLNTHEEQSTPQAITKGAFVVTEIVTWDVKSNLIYYLANTAEDSSVQHLYSVSPTTLQTKCISCGLKTKRGTVCTYNTAEFSKSDGFYVLTCSGPDVPEVTLYSSAHEKVLEWDDNEEIGELVHDKAIPELRKMSFDIADGFKAQVSLKLPPNMDTSGATKYPVLVNVYGGPDSYQVIDKFNLDWGSYLAANKSIIYVTIDGRGSGLKGDKILFAGYRKLGTVEVIDQINVTRLIQNSLPFVDAERTAIWGWSYGGYAAGMALATDTENVFKCGISVAPVTDWALYDSIYTERFMGLPTFDDNLKGYQEAQLFNKFEGLRKKFYFLIHGTFDDNVHYQQSMLWAKVLEENDILFRQLSYTDEDHGLGLVRPHLYHSLESFLDECFTKEN